MFFFSEIFVSNLHAFCCLLSALRTSVAKLEAFKKLSTEQEKIPEFNSRGTLAFIFCRKHIHLQENLYFSICKAYYAVYFYIPVDVM